MVGADLSANIDALPVGGEIAGFRITKVLGAGSFGITYEALDTGLDRRVALKEFFPFDYARRMDGGFVQPKSDQAAEVFNWALERFSDEAKTLAKFSHPNIVRVTQIIPNVNGTAYIVMEFLEGVTLEDWVLKHGLPSADQTKRVFRQLLDGCAAIHKYGILHRDIKPSNVMLAGENGQLEGARPLLIDFGSARDLALQRTGFSAVVTDGYSPPEQYSRSTTQGPPADLYALAATMFFLLTGETPPPSAARLSDPLPPIPPERMQAFGPKFIQQLLRGLELQVDKRPQTVEQWLPALDLDDQPLSVAPGGVSRRALLIAGGGVGALAVAGGAAWWFTRPADLSGSGQPLRLAATRNLSEIGVDTFAQIAPVKDGAMVGAHRIVDGAPRMLAMHIGDALDTKHEWIDDQADGEAVSILPAAEGGAHVGGRQGSNATVVRLSADWKVQWRVQRGEGRVTAILPNPKGVLIGIEGLDKAGARIETLDNSGKLIWGVDVDKGKDESVQRVIAMKDGGGYAVLGWGTQARETSAGMSNESYTWIAILDSNGKQKQRAQTNGLGAAAGTDLIEAVGKIFVVGRTSESKPDSPPHIFVWALNHDGTEAWIRTNYPITPSSLRAVSVTPGNALYATGWANDPPSMRIVQVGATGDLLWQAVFKDAGATGVPIDMAMRGDGDGFALLSSPGNAEVNQLVAARIMT